MKKLTLCLAALFGFSVFSTSSFAMGDRLVASVNGAPILESQVNALLRHQKKTPETKKAALERIVDDLLIQTSLQKAKNNFPEKQFQQILSQEVERQMHFIAQQNGMSLGQFILALTNEGISVDNYRRQIAQSIAAPLREQMMMAGLRDQVMAEKVEQIRQELSREEIEKEAKALQEKAKAAGKDKAVLSKEYQVRHILLTLNPLMNDKQAKAELNQLRKDILANKISFSKAALIHSKDFLSGANGGELGYQLPELYDPAFARAILNTQKGKISLPFKTNFGWHILEVMDSRDKNVTDEVYMQKAYEMLMHQRLAKVEKEWLSVLRDNADIQIIE